MKRRIRRAFGSLVACLIAAACSDGVSDGLDPASGAETERAERVGVEPPALDGLTLDTVASGLDVPWDMAFAPDGRIFVTERPGRIRIIEDGVLRAEPWASLEVFGEDPDLRPESGLLGIALAPDFSETGHVYVFATVSFIPENRLARFWNTLTKVVLERFGDRPDTRWQSRIYRLTDRSGFATGQRTIVDSLPASYYHAGGALEFGPDGKLYTGIGDTLDPDRAQDSTSLVGKILRYNPDGTVPADNPIPGSPVYALGLRNTQGLAWHPRTGELFAVEHGPSFLPHEDGRHGHDEINIIVPGGNYGWPAVIGETDDPEFVSPLVVWSPAIAPPALAFVDPCETGDSSHLAVTGLRGQQLRLLELERHAGSPTGWRVLEQVPVLEQTFGRLRRVAVADDGAVFLTTSNRDGRGDPRPLDDLIIRVDPTDIGVAARGARDCAPRELARP